MKFAVFPFLALFAFTFPAAAVAADEVVVQTVNYPLAYFAERIATDSFDIQYRIDPSGDPAFWKPGDEDIAAFQQADAILLNGATYEKWMKTVTLPRSIMVDTSRGFSDRFIEVKSGEHRHGDGQVHSHAGTAFTTWIDFSQAVKQAEAISEKFQQLVPDDSKEIRQNFKALKSDLEKLDSAMKKFGRKWGDAPLAASHPIYQYLARAYGLKIEALEWEPEMEFTSQAKHDLEHLLQLHPIKWMIWEGEPTDTLVEGIASMGVKSIVFSPGANKSEGSDWLATMQQNVRNLNAMLEASR